MSESFNGRKTKCGGFLLPVMEQPAVLTQKIIMIDWYWVEEEDLITEIMERSYDKEI